MTEGSTADAENLGRRPAEVDDATVLELPVARH